MYSCFCVRFQRTIINQAEVYSHLKRKNSYISSSSACCRVFLGFYDFCNILSAEMEKKRELLIVVSEECWQRFHPEGEFFKFYCDSGKKLQQLLFLNSEKFYWNETGCSKKWKLKAKCSLQKFSFKMLHSTLTHIWTSTNIASDFWKYSQLFDVKRFFDACRNAWQTCCHSSTFQFKVEKWIFWPRHDDLRV